jgi:hypothetical protein
VFDLVAPGGRLEHVVRVVVWLVGNDVLREEVDVAFAKPNAEDRLRPTLLDAARFVAAKTLDASCGEKSLKDRAREREYVHYYAFHCDVDGMGLACLAATVALGLTVSSSTHRLSTADINSVRAHVACMPNGVRMLVCSKVRLCSAVVGSCPNADGQELRACAPGIGILRVASAR